MPECFLGEPFQHDLFVSYSHGAFAGKHDSDLKLWSQKFAMDLRAELAGTGEFDGISVFLDEGERSDENVDRTAQLTGQLRDRVTRSALFTLLMTQHYLRSKWCRQELDWWSEKHYPDTLGAGSRVYVCRVRHSEGAAWPEHLKDLVGYFCYDRDKNPDKARPFTWKGAQHDLDDYVNLLADVSGEMMQRLRALKGILDEQRRQEQQARRYADPNGLTLFLHGRESVKDAWGRACDVLQDAGFFVVPEGPVPVADDGGLHPEYHRQLRKSDGLLLLGAEEGPAIDTDIIVIGRNYRREAIAEGSSLPGVVVNMVGPGLRTERRLRNTRNLGLGWIDANVDGLPNQVRSWLVEASVGIEAVPVIGP
jgi:hypothetical protein